MPEIDPSVFDVDPLAPDAGARMQALIRLLGQQQQGNIMGAMGGTLRTGMQHLGQGMEQQAQQQMGMVQGAPAARLKLAMEKLAQQKAQQEQDVMKDPATASFLRQAMARFGAQAPEGTPAAVMQHSLPTVEKGFAAQETARARRAQTDATTQWRSEALDERKREADMKASKAKEVPARQLERYAQLKATIQALGPYMQQLEQATTGPVMGRLSAINPLRGGATAGAIATGQALQMKLARALHGGVPTKIEIESAGNYVPGLNDTPEQRQAKHAALMSLFADEEATLKQTYGEGGMNTSRLTTAGAPAHPDDAAALQWAKANPSDPRAAKILQLAGGSR